MPNVSTYIRTEDLSKYLAIHEKGEWAEFIHKALNKSEAPKISRDTTIPLERRKIIKTPEDAVDTVKEIFPNAEPITYKKTGNWGA